ncbi:1-phosphofructokinase family hexose kinase [Rubrolithibacter danxiaensis]|uniref:1-phosphofructokinase family hexose kinase n=1 Tax=Rubrolithibacter danxiaensis TaxID=3390805 RepID=UPI003BF8DE50
MAKIVTLTLNPTVDKSTSVDKLLPEQKLNCAAPKYEPGGGGINVSRALKRLDTDSVAIFPSGGRTGQLLQSLLEKEQIEVEVVETENENRENFIVVDNSSNQQFRFGMPGPELYAQEIEKFIPLIEKQSPSCIIVSGSMPAGVSPEFIGKVGFLSKKIGAKFIVDTSGDALQAALNEGVYLLKPNLGELGKLVGVQSLDNESVESAAKELIGQGKCEIIVVSMGGAGAHLITKDSTEHIPAPTVKKMSTVGAGDSMVAGMIYAITRGESLSAMVRWGVACGTAATMNPGTELFKREDAERLYQWLMKRGQF